jgi:hypothetical protein
MLLFFATLWWYLENHKNFLGNSLALLLRLRVHLQSPGNLADFLATNPKFFSFAVFLLAFLPRLRDSVNFLATNPKISQHKNFSSKKPRKTLFFSIIVTITWVF